MKKRIFFLAIALCLLLAIPVGAVQFPNLQQTGSITILMDWDGEKLNSGSLSISRVAEVVHDNGDCVFVAIEPLQGLGLDLKHPTTPELAQEMERLVHEKKLPQTTSPVEKGKAVFENLPTGLYVVMQSEQQRCNGFDPIDPFLLSVPKSVDNLYYFTVEGDPKVPLETRPPEPTKPAPPKPDDSKLPQTGQLNWPVPLLTVCGLMLFVLGWYLRFGDRKDSHET